MTGFGDRILVVDDDLAANRLVQLTLGRMGGYDVRTATCPNDAMNFLDREHFTLAIIDAMMTGMDGLTFCRHIRSRSPAHAAMPIVMLSAATPEELGWSDLSDGPSLWLRKPVRPTDLLAQVRALLTP